MNDKSDISVALDAGSQRLGAQSVAGKAPNPIPTAEELPDKEEDHD